MIIYTQLRSQITLLRNLTEELWSQPLDDPALVPRDGGVGLLLAPEPEPDPVVDPVALPLPELHRVRHHPVAAPVGLGDLLAPLPVLGQQLLLLLCQDTAVLDNLRAK